MDWFIILMRILHIFAGVYWAGTAFFLVGVLSPTVEAAGPEGGQFMGRIMGGSRYTPLISSASGLTALTGIILYWRVSGQLSPGWIMSGTGLSLTIGGIAGLIATIHGGAVLSRKSRELVDLGRQISANAGPPSPEQLQGVQKLQQDLSNGGQFSAILLAVAVLGMSAARYLWF